MTATSPGNGTLGLRSVCKRCGTGQGGQVTAADEVTFTIEAAAFVVLTGPPARLSPCWGTWSARSNAPAPA